MPIMFRVPLAQINPLPAILLHNAVIAFVAIGLAVTFGVRHKNAIVVIALAFGVVIGLIWRHVNLAASVVHQDFILEPVFHFKLFEVPEGLTGFILCWIIPSGIAYVVTWSVGRLRSNRSNRSNGT